MKKLTLLLAAACVIGAAGAVTHKMTVEPVGDYIRLDTGEFVLVESQEGTCELSGPACSYDKIANEGSEPMFNPANFEAKDTGHWEPAN